MSKRSPFLSYRHLDKYFFIKFLPILFVAIFLSVSYYTYFIFNDTLKAIENSKIKEVEEAVIQITNGFNLSIKKHQVTVDDLLDQPGFRVALDIYNDISIDRQKNFRRFLERKYDILNKQLPYLKGYYCIGNDGTYIGGKPGYYVDFNKFIKSDTFKELSNNDVDNVWIVNKSADWLISSEDKDISIVHKVFDKSNKVLVGYYIISMDFKILDTFYYKNSVDGALKVVLLDGDNNPICTTNRNYLELKVDEIIEGNQDGDFKSLYQVDGDKYLVIIKSISTNGWKVLVYANKKHLTANLRSNITGHLIPMILYSLLISLIIFLESYMLLKVVTDKQNTDYKLQLTNNMNDKLRMYKHDFMNQLQIVSGLIELKFYDKAHEYIVNTANEGISINKYGDIGVPEIESIVYAAIAKAIEKEYEVHYDFIKLDDKFYVDTYDLSRILLNLTKNAIYALDSSDDSSKSLTIKIYEELGCYIFKISNSTPIIPEDIRNHIFEKGFSTKGNDGKGLGLYIVRQLVKRNGGILSLQVNDKGNHFIVSFPIDKD